MRSTVEVQNIRRILCVFPHYTPSFGAFHHAYSLMFGLLCLSLQVFLPYQRYVRYLRWLTLALLSYVAVVFFIDVPWLEGATPALDRCHRGRRSGQRRRRAFGHSTGSATQSCAGCVVH